MSRIGDAPTPWLDALGKVRAMSSRGTTPQGNPVITNREASGLILFARSAAAYGRDHGAPGLAFDNWYQLSLPVLGWLAPGDKFIMSDEHQLATTAPHDAIWQALGDIARKLDEAKVPLAIGAIGSPSGTDATYRKLAGDAWKVMQASDPSSAAAVKPSSTSKTPSPAPSAAATQPSDVEASRKKDKGSGAGSGGAVLALFALLLLADDDNRKRRRSY